MRAPKFYVVGVRGYIWVGCCLLACLLAAAAVLVVLFVMVKVAWMEILY